MTCPPATDYWFSKLYFSSLAYLFIFEEPPPDLALVTVGLLH